MVSLHKGPIMQREWLCPELIMVMCAMVCQMKVTNSHMGKIKWSKYCIIYNHICQWQSQRFVLWMGTILFYMMLWKAYLNSRDSVNKWVYIFKNYLMYFTTCKILLEIFFYNFTWKANLQNDSLFTYQAYFEPYQSLSSAQSTPLMSNLQTHFTDTQLLIAVSRRLSPWEY